MMYEMLDEAAFEEESDVLPLYEPNEFRTSDHDPVIFLAGYPLSRQIACESNAPSAEVDQTVNAGGSILTYDSLTDQYTYVWKTNKSWAGTCRQFIMILKDGSIHIANFQFK
jgi:hypothetical protein